MIRAPRILATGLLPVILALASCQSSPDRAPTLRVSVDRLDLGTAAPGEEQTATLTLRNEGTRPLHLVRTITAEGVRVQLEPEDVLPGGGQGHLRLAVTAPELPGSWERGITLVTNDPASPLRHLHVTGTTASRFAVVPSPFPLGPLRQGESSPWPLRILTTDGVQARSVTTAGSILVAKLARDEKEPRIELSIHPEAPAGAFRETVTVESTDRVRPRVEVEVYGRVTKEEAR